MATMLLHNALHGRQTYAGSWKVLWAVQPLENSEKLVGVLHTEADSVVAHKDGRFGPPVQRTYFNNCPFPLAGKFDCIRKQVHENLFQQAWIAIHERERLDVPLDRAL